MRMTANIENNKNIQNIKNNKNIENDISIKRRKENNFKPKIPLYFNLSLQLKSQILPKINSLKLINLPLLQPNSLNYFFWKEKCKKYGLPENNSLNSFYCKVSRIENLKSTLLYENNPFIINLKITDVTKLIMDTENIYISSNLGKILQFNLKSKIFEKINLHKRGVWAIDSFKNKDKNILMTGSIDTKVNIIYNKKRFSFNNHSSTIREVKIYENYGFAASRDSTISIYNLETSNPSLLNILEGHRDSVRCLSVYKNLLVSGSYDKTVKIWNYKKGKLLKTIMHEGKVYCIKTTENFIITADFEGFLKIICRKKLKILFSKKVCEKLITHIEIMHDYSENIYKEVFIYFISVSGEFKRICLNSFNLEEIQFFRDIPLNNLKIYSNYILVSNKRGLLVYNEKNEFKREILSYRHILDFCIKNCLAVIFEEDCILKLAIYS